MKRPLVLFRMIYQALLRTATPIGLLLLRTRFYGLRNVPRKGPYILCCNHRSVIDPFMIAMAIPQHLYFMAKSELFTDHGPLAAGLLKAMGAFPVHRDRADIQSLRTAEEILNRGDILAIFPQGRVLFDNTPFRPKSGAVLLAARTGIPILPVSIWCKGPWQLGKRITIRFGQLLSAQTFSGAEKNRQVMRNSAKLLANQINHQLEEEHGF